MDSPLLVPILAMLAAGGVAYVFLFPLLSGQRKAELRMREFAVADTAIRRSRRGGPDPSVARRQQVEESLKELDARRRNARRPPLQVRITQAGLSWSRRKYFTISGVIALIVLLLGLLLGWPIYMVPFAAFVAGVGLPRWLLGYLKKRREQKFLREFPNAVDVIVRGVKSGLPLGDCIRIVAAESQEPVRSEFRHVVETTALGIPLADACVRLYERTPLAETSFFSIVVAIQAKSGGNLSETLGNLSRVLRDRRKMQEKIQAMSMEAKASASIIGALPVIVLLLVYLTTPGYIATLWTEPMGRLMLAGSAVWMTLGILVMRRMINFDF